MKHLGEIHKTLSQPKSVILEDKTRSFARVVPLDFQIKPTLEGFLLFFITCKRLFVREIMSGAKKEHPEECSNRLLPDLWTTVRVMPCRDKRSKQLLAEPGPWRARQRCWLWSCRRVLLWRCHSALTAYTSIRARQGLKQKVAFHSLCEPSKAKRHL